MAYVPGVTAQKWARVWQQRRAGTPLRLLPADDAAGRRDVITRPLATAETTEVGVVWLAADRTDLAERLLQELIGIVRGRTAHSSRGTAEPSTSGRRRRGTGRA